ncbi:hypothetical protein BVRB_6g147970 [Beta vulgaris subsp. vulgaris]|nr:hypothetical protein BVRB_6g147970 [Beta vulgaris subsp. vulgaris]
MEPRLSDPHLEEQQANQMSCSFTKERKRKVVNENGEIREDMSEMGKTLKVAAPMKSPIDIMYDAETVANGVTHDARRERHTP